MGLKLEIVNPLTFAGWDDLLVLNRDHAFFHSSAWARVLCESYRYKPTYFALIDHGQLLVLLPVMEVSSFLTGRRGVSLPFSDFCEPLITDEVPFQDALGCVLQYGRSAGWKFLELRGGDRFQEGVPAIGCYYGHTLDLTQNGDRLLPGLRSSTRRNIRKAIKEGVAVDICHSLDSMGRFYRLNCITRKRHGLPPQPRRFFERLFDYVISRNYGFVALASHKGRTVAGSVYLHFGERGMFKYGASDSRFQHLRANNLIMWEAIRWYAQNGYRSLSLGRTEPGNEGLLQFKDGWGAEKQMTHYFRYGIGKRTPREQSARSRGLYRRFFQQLPIPLSRVAGSLLYRHVG